MNRVVWFERGFLPVHFGFCPNERAWKHEMKKFGAAGVDAEYPTSDGKCTSFAKPGTDTAIIVTINERLDGRSLVDIMALIAHEAVHVWQSIRAEMGEDAPSIEFEAWTVQYIVMHLGNAYKEMRMAAADAPAETATS